MGIKKDTVLVVDDIEMNIEVLKTGLSLAYNVITATSGEEALKIVEKTKDIDIILLDIMMPKMSGYEVIEVLKSKDETKDIPVIFVTAMQETMDETKGLSLGAADYITKPVKFPVIMARISTHITISKQSKKLEKQNKELQKVVRILEKKLSDDHLTTLTEEVIDSKEENQLLDETDGVVQKDENKETLFKKEHIKELNSLINDIDCTINTFISKSEINNKDKEKISSLLVKYSSIIGTYSIFTKLFNGLEHFCKVLKKNSFELDLNNQKYAISCLESFGYTLKKWHVDILNNGLKDPNKYVNSILSDIEEIRLLVKI